MFLGRRDWLPKIDLSCFVSSTAEDFWRVALVFTADIGAVFLVVDGGCFLDDNLVYLFGVVEGAYVLVSVFDDVDPLLSGITIGLLDCFAF